MSEQSARAEDASACLGRASDAPISPREGLIDEPAVGLRMLAMAADGDACTDGLCAIPGAGASEGRPNADR